MVSLNILEFSPVFLASPAKSAWRSPMGVVVLFETIEFGYVEGLRFESGPARCGWSPQLCIFSCCRPLVSPGPLPVCSDLSASVRQYLRGRLVRPTARRFSLCVYVVVDILLMDRGEPELVLFFFSDSPLARTLCRSRLVAVIP